MKKRSNGAIMRELIRMAKPLYLYFVAAILLGTAGHACAAGIPVLGALLVWQIQTIGKVPATMVLLGSLMLVAILRAIFRYAEQLSNHFIAFRLLAVIRTRIFEALRRLAPAKLEGRQKGDLIAVITADIELLEVFYAHTVSPVAIAVLFSGVVCGLIAHYHWLLALIAVIGYLIIGLVIPLTISALNHNAGRLFRSHAGALSSFMLDSLRGLAEILQYQMNTKRLDELAQKTDNLISHEKKMKTITAVNIAVTNTVIIILDLVMLFTAIWLYQSRAVEFDGVLIPVIAFMSSFGPVVALAGLGSTLQNTLAAGERVLDILEEVPVVKEVFHCPPVGFTGAAVQNVVFSYDQEPVLRDVSMNIAPRSVVAVTGQSGSGKSTLLRLLMRFFDAQQGQVLLSDTPVTQINTKNIRDLESYMTQETHLFHDSIINNLRIAKRDATQEEIDRACQMASIYDFIKGLPNGYETLIAELGTSLSGGERQRLGLARAFLHQAPLLLLDEPTSNLDSLNEAIILRALAQAAGEKTILLVSHRQSTLSIANQVYHITQGQIQTKYAME